MEKEFMEKEFIEKEFMEKEFIEKENIIELIKKYNIQRISYFIKVM